MQDQINLLKNYLLYILTGVLICLVGVSNVLADSYTYEDIGYFTNQSQVQVEVNYTAQPLTISQNQHVQLEQVYSLDIFINNLNLVHDYIYYFEIYIPSTILTRANIAQVIWYGDNNTTGNCSIITTYFSNNYPHVTFKCNGSTNIKSLYIRYYNSSNQYLFDAQQFYWNYTFMRRRTPSSTDNTGEIKDALNQQTQDIINNQNQNTQDIIDNQNSIAEQQEKQQEVCDVIDKGSIIEQNKKLNSTGVIESSNAYGLTDFVKIGKSLTRVYGAGGTSAYFCWYDSSKTLLSCQTLSSFNSSNVTIPSDAVYFRTSIETSANRPIFKVCYDGNQAVNDTNKGIFAKIKELFSWFTNDDDADVSGLNNMVGWLPPGPVDSIINLPLSFFNALTNTLSGTCQNVTLNLPFVNQTLTLYCFDAYMSQYLTHFGTFWNLVGFIVSIFILYNYLLALYKWVDDTLTFRENNLPGYYGDNWGGGA